MGKGSKRRPPQISEAEEGLRYDLALGKITREEFDKRLAALDKLERSPRYQLKNT